MVTAQLYLVSPGSTSLFVPSRCIPVLGCSDCPIREREIDVKPKPIFHSGWCMDKDDK